MQFNKIIRVCSAALVVSVAASFSGFAQAECTFFTGWVNNKDGTVTDPRNGLIWKRCAEGFEFSNGICAGVGTKADWDSAQAIAQQSRFLNNSDWRLPTQEELAAVMGSYDECKGNTEDEYAASKAIAHQRGVFWSSSPYVSYSNYAWLVGFGNGSVDYSSRTHDFYVRLVRAGQVLGGEAALEFTNEPAEIAAKKKVRQLQIYRDTFKKAYSSNEFDSFITAYRNDDPDNLIPQAEAKKQAAIKREAAEEKSRQLQIYRDAFKSAYSSSDLDNFISTYRKNDPDKLIPKAEAKKRAALAQEHKEAERQRRADAYRREHACDDLYVGKVVNAPVTGLVTLFGKKSERAIIIGISHRNKVITVRSVSDSNMIGEISCDSLQ